MKLFLIYFFYLIHLMSVEAINPEAYKMLEKELSKHYNIDNLKLEEIKLLSNDIDLFYKIYDEDENLGIAVITSAKGRFDMFDYMIVYNLEREIELIKILVYRSEYGSEITAKRWLSQFYTNQIDSLKYGNDIQAISGATFSASSLTKNVNRINKILCEFIKTGD